MAKAQLKVQVEHAHCWALLLKTQGNLVSFEDGTPMLYKSRKDARDAAQKRGGIPIQVGVVEFMQ